MDFAYLNAVVKSGEFPPFDPWFAGGYINYYYFGFVLVAALVELTAVVPAVAYNLAVATFAASLGAAAFGLAAALATGRRTPVAAPRRHRSPRPALRRRRRQPRRAAPGLGAPERRRSRSNAGTGSRRGRSRTRSTSRGRSTEFPAFTYLYADLHAHAMALPFTAVVLGLALVVARVPRQERAPRLALLGLLALVLGSLWPLNTWDVPTYAVAVGLVFGIAALAGGSVGRARRLLVAGAAVVGRPRSSGTSPICRSTSTTCPRSTASSAGRAAAPRSPTTSSCTASSSSRSRPLCSCTSSPPGTSALLVGLHGCFAAGPRGFREPCACIGRS